MVEVTRVWEDSPIDIWNRKNPTRKLEYGSRVRGTLAGQECTFFQQTWRWARMMTLDLAPNCSIDMYWQHIISIHIISTCYMHEAHWSADSPDHVVGFGWLDEYSDKLRLGARHWGVNGKRSGQDCLNRFVMVTTHDICMLLGQMISKSWHDNAATE